MEVYTDAEGAQFYMGGFLHGPLRFKGRVPKKRYHAFCFETQGEPDGIHHGTPPLRAGEPFRSITVYRFI
jgi:galactose mutarotase-like enzyme